MVSFGNNFFGFNYHSTDDDGNSIEQMCKVVVRNYIIARNLFRSVTEEQVFFYQKTVPLQVANHVERRQKRLRKFCSKVFKMQFEATYYYDIVHTKMEAYRHAWQLLHQVEEEELDLGPRSQSEAPLTEEVEVAGNNLSNTVCQNVQKTEVYRGLSTTTCEIAKQLLPESQLHLSVSEDLLMGEGGTVLQELAVTKQSLQPLSEAQGKKLRQLLLNIQDERMCQLCMDELTSSVFCPCGHNVACYKCARRLDKCPVCRHFIGYVQYVYGTS